MDENDLIEQHPELRLRFFPTNDAFSHLKSRLLSQPGAYEWWQLEAFDNEGTGLHLCLYNGDPFHPVYRQAVRRNLDGKPTEPAHLHPSTFPAVRLSVFERKELVARAYWTAEPNSFTVKDKGDDWSVQVGPVLLQSSRECSGWSVVIEETATQKTGWRAALGMNREPGRTVRATIDIIHAFNTTSMSRAAMPDAPNGATHEWTLLAPAARCSGVINLGGVDHDHGHKQLTLNGAFGSLHHFHGSGLIGNGMRRWYRGSMVWKDGAVLCELPIIRKYIQLAGTLSYFTPGQPPVILRCDHQRTTTFQRSAWLLAHPLEVHWRQSEFPAELTLPVKRLQDALPFRGISLCDTQFAIGRVPDDLVVGPGLGIFELLQPSRADWRLYADYLSG